MRHWADTPKTAPFRRGRMFRFLDFLSLSSSGALFNDGALLANGDVRVCSLRRRKQKRFVWQKMQALLIHCPHE